MIYIKERKCLFIGVVILIIIFVLSGCVSDQDKSEKTEGTVGDLFSYTIIGIDPSSGVMKNTETALDEYNLKQAGWGLKTGTSDTMMNALLENVSEENPIIITIWSPHAVFGVTELRKLNDPKEIYNKPDLTIEFLKDYAPEWKDIDVASDIIASIVPTDFSNSSPAADEFLHKFNISDTIQSEWIHSYTIEEQNPADIAKQWVDTNREIVDLWMPDNTTAIGNKDLILGQPDWPGVTVKNQIASLVLQEIGYNTSIIKEDAGAVYNDLINGQVDIMLAGWLPATHGDYWEGNSDILKIAGINVHQTWLGLAIPDYMDEQIKSIGDLNN